MTEFSVCICFNIYFAVRRPNWINNLRLKDRWLVGLIEDIQSHPSDRAANRVWEVQWFSLLVVVDEKADCVHWCIIESKNEGKQSEMSSQSWPVHVTNNNYGDLIKEFKCVYGYCCCWGQSDELISLQVWDIQDEWSFGDGSCHSVEWPIH